MTDCTFNHCDASGVTGYAEFMDADIAYVLLTIAARQDQFELTTYYPSEDSLFDGTALSPFRVKAAYEWLLRTNIIVPGDCPPNNCYDPDGLFLFINCDALDDLRSHYSKQKPRPIDAGGITF